MIDDVSPEAKKQRIKEALAAFLAEGIRARELRIGPMRLYVRVGMRAAHAAAGLSCLGRTLEIAQIDVQEAHRGRGWATAAVEATHEINPHAMTYIEIASPKMASIAWKLDFYEREGSWGNPDFFKPTVTDPERTVVMDNDE